MRFERSVGHVLIGMLCVMLAMLASTVYWTTFSPESALTSPFNYRRQDVEAAIRRGAILDRQGIPLVETIMTADGGLQRRTLAQAYASLTGYASRQFGRAGAEAAYDEILRGTASTSDLDTMIRQDLLHLPRVGFDVRLTIDAGLQRSASAALQSQIGAAVIIDAVTGEVLALASSPSVVPADLDRDWETLITRDDKPFLNRALQGRYLPGNMLLSPLMTAWLISGRSLDDALAINPSEPFSIDDASLPCQFRPPGQAMTVRDVLVYGCPAGAAEMIARLGLDTVAETYALFQLGTHSSLIGFPDAEAAAGTTNVLSTMDILGHGSLRLSPLDLAVMESAILSGGNAPRPYMLDATRAPETTNWVSAQRMRESLPVTTSTTANAINGLLRRSAEVVFADVATVQMGARVALIQDGSQTNAWFVGSMNLGGDRRVVTVLLIENAPTTEITAERGRVLVEIAHQVLSIR